MYFRDIDDPQKYIKDFYEKKDRFSHVFEEEKIDIIIDNVPKMMIPDELSKKIVGYEFLNNYEVNVNKFSEDILKIKEANKLYIRNKYKLKNISSKKTYIVYKNIILFIKNRKFIIKDNNINILKNLFKLLVMLIISFLLTCISFCYTNYLLDMEMINSYFEFSLFILNFIPVFLLILLFSILTKRIHVSFAINSFWILILGIANQTKILYRDDIVKFEDLTIIKEALIMGKKYGVIIRWYTILFVILLILIFFLLKRFFEKYSFSWKKGLLLSCLLGIFVILIYNTIYNNDRIYDSIGDENLINKWITTRQYQIRGLIYPFVYTIKDIADTKPNGYSKEKAEEILSNYKYEDIDNDKKVNIIAIMLEAYNDFSKFNVIDFNDDIYEKFHEIQSKLISGNLVTTIFGGGTVNTERKFLTGYNNMPSFRKITNSYVWYFKEQGYRTEAMHPIYGAFYNRTSINPNLGFDDYYYYENKFSKIQNEFMTDYDFFDYIIDGYEKSKNDNMPYFNFSVTYQNHGPYNANKYEGKEYFFDNIGYDSEAYNTINEYFSGIKKTNVALEKIINYFENEEATIIVIFGDHNPYLGKNNLAYNELGINLDLGTIDGFENYYETPYIIYGNNAAKKMFNNKFIGKGNTISPIFLMSEISNLLGMKGNNYLQYMNDLEKKVDVLSEEYYKEDGQFISVDKSNIKKLINEYNIVNYYYSRNFIKR